VNIIPFIRDLLLRNQKAVIPGFGTFFIIQRPAQLNKVTRVLTPPSTVVRFDKTLMADDGKLAEMITGKSKQGKPASYEIIEGFVQSTLDELTEKGSIELSTLGTITRTKTGDFDLKPDEDLLNRISLFDLPNVRVPVSKSETVPVPPPVIKPASPKPPVEKPPVGKTEVKQPVVVIRKRRKWWIPVSILVLLFIAGAGLYYTGLIGDVSGIFNSKSDIKTEDNKLVFGKSHAAENTDVIKDSTDDISRELDERTSRENALAIDEAAEKTENATAEKEIPQPENTAEIAVNNNLPFHIIAGAFLVPNNADRQVEQLSRKGLTATVLPKKGDYFMVSLGSYATSDEATAAMSAMKDKAGSQMWVMKR
jgi:nucleoid DNA-binding protein